jgi:hypothetical protein
MGAFGAPSTPSFGASCSVAFNESSMPAFGRSSSTLAIQSVQHDGFRRITPAFSASSTLDSRVTNTPFSFGSMPALGQKGSTFGTSSPFFGAQCFSFGMCYFDFLFNQD